MASNNKFTVTQMNERNYKYHRYIYSKLVTEDSFVSKLIINGKSHNLELHILHSKTHYVDLQAFRIYK